MNSLLVVNTFDFFQMEHKEQVQVIEYSYLKWQKNPLFQIIIIQNGRSAAQNHLLLKAFYEAGFQKNNIKLSLTPDLKRRGNWRKLRKMSDIFDLEQVFIKGMEVVTVGEVNLC